MPAVAAYKGDQDKLDSRTKQSERASRLSSKTGLEPRESYAASRGSKCHMCGTLDCGAQISPADGPSQEPSPYSPLELQPDPRTCAGLTQRHLPLLDLEHDVEIDQQVEQADLSKLERLLVAKTERTPRGLRLWVLRLDGDDGQLLPKHNIRAREPVEVIREDSEEFDADQRAVVYHVTDYELTLIMNDEVELTLDKVVEVSRVDDDRMYWRMREVLQGLSTISGRAGRLRESLFAERPLESVAELPAKLINANGELQLFNTRLNALQREAVKFALRQKRLAIIHGPPGTGKTTTVVETILQHLKLGHRILACAPSNTAVDNLVERLAEAEFQKMVRLGHPARIRENVLDFWVDNLADVLDGNDANRHHDKKGASRIHKKRMRRVIEKSQVVLCTLANTSAEGPLGPPLHLGVGAFDLVVIDECSQSVEAACWLAVQRTGKLLLAGDHCQLPPTILSELAARRGLAVSLMERQVDLHGEAAVCMLCTQYRMHELIQQWPSERLYGGLLEAAPAVRHHRLPQLPGVRETADTAPTLLLIDTAGCQLTEAKPDETHSRRNDGEADLVTAHVAALVRDGVLQHQIGVIAPYKAQTARVRAGLRQRRVGDVEVHSVDGFQGREKEVVLLSMVRSKKKCSLKFVADQRRINVAVTRARRQLVIVCDSATMRRDEGMQSLIEHVRKHGEVRSARSYVNELGVKARHHYVPDNGTGSDLVQGQTAKEPAPKAVKDKCTSSNVSKVSSISESSPGNSQDKKSAKNEQAVSKAVANITAAITGADCLTDDQCPTVNGEAEDEEAANKQAEGTSVGRPEDARQTSVVTRSVVSPAAKHMAAVAAAISAAKCAATDCGTDGGNSNYDVGDPAVSSAADSLASALNKMIISGR